MKTRRQNIGILGLGQVGKAVEKLTKQYYSVYPKDLNQDKLCNNRIDILHVCIPYTNKFVQLVSDQIKLNNPQLTIIHSTVIPGTTRKIYNKMGTLIAHSPIMGIHPNLFFYLFKFPKFIGAINKMANRLTFDHFLQMKLNPISYNKPEETELAKLLDTSYYGINIVFCKLVNEICDTFKLDFNNVYTVFNQAYNKGYSKTLPHVRRPILQPTKGPIGGHCIVPNSILLNKIIPNNYVSNLILSWQKHYKEK